MGKNYKAPRAILLIQQNQVTFWRSGMKGARLLQGSAFVGALIVLNTVPVTPVLAVSISIAGPAGAYTQDFDTLANSGTSSSLPDDWVFIETGTGANNTYAVSTGSSTGGNTYSFGADGSAERALGSLRTGTVISSFGVHFENGGSTAIDGLVISYTGEQWRLGAAGRVDRLDFQYSLDATSLTTGSWTDFDALDFSTPNVSVTGVKDGDLPANQTLLSGTIGGLSLAPLASIWFRWTDFDASGSDDGLAVDNFRLEATFLQPVDPNPGPTSGVPDTGGALGLFGVSVASLCIVARRRRPARLCRAAG